MNASAIRQSALPREPKPFVQFEANLGRLGLNALRSNGEKLLFVALD